MTIITKQKILKTIEKYRKPGQFGVVDAEVLTMWNTADTGLVAVKIYSFDGIPWIIIAKLKDIIILNDYNKIRVVNIRNVFGYIEIVTNISGYNVIKISREEIMKKRYRKVTSEEIKFMEDRACEMFARC